jgi:hypothetical protein
MRIEVDEYLGTVLPALLRASRRPGLKARTTIQLVVADLEGCDYYYRIQDDGVEVFRGISDEVDLTLSFVSRDLGDLTERKLDVGRAVRAARIRVFGNEEVLKWLSLRLVA